MLLSDILEEPTAALRHMERYVNVGSPSGFTATHNTSWETNPCGPVPSFQLQIGAFPTDRVIDDGIAIPYLASDEIAIHPDMAAEPLIRRNCARLRPSDFVVAPTSSSRTVEIVSAAHAGYYKLNYKGLIGRADRQLTRLHAISGVELTAMLSAAIDARLLPPVFAFLPEPAGRIAVLDDENGDRYEWGMVYRTPRPYPDFNYAFAIPVFALFSRDTCHGDDPLLLTQLINRQERAPDRYLFEEIIAPLLSCYFELLLNCALQLECHAQNALLAFDEQCRVRALVVRDLESVDKDVSLAQERGIDVTFRSSPYKTLQRDQYNYAIMHSFMYDFKLGEYFIAPLIDVVERDHHVDTKQLVKSIKELAQNYIAQLPESFFPADGQWYYYENIIHERTKRRPYLAKPSPKYR